MREKKKYQGNYDTLEKFLGKISQGKLRLL